MEPKHKTSTENCTNPNQLAIGLVDTLAEGLVVEYENPKYRSWYCKVIYTFGPALVEDWRARASDSNDPARLFSKLAKEAFQRKEYEKMRRHGQASY